MFGKLEFGKLKFTKHELGKLEFGKLEFAKLNNKEDVQQTRKYTFLYVFDSLRRSTAWICSDLEASDRFAISDQSSASIIRFSHPAEPDFLPRVVATSKSTSRAMHASSPCWFSLIDTPMKTTDNSFKEAFTCKKMLLISKPKLQMYPYQLNLFTD